MCHIVNESRFHLRDFTLFDELVKSTCIRNNYDKGK